MDRIVLSIMHRAENFTKKKLAKLKAGASLFVYATSQRSRNQCHYCIHICSGLLADWSTRSSAERIYLAWHKCNPARCCRDVLLLAIKGCTSPPGNG